MVHPSRTARIDVEVAECEEGVGQGENQGQADRLHHKRYRTEHPKSKQRQATIIRGAVARQVQGTRCERWQTSHRLGMQAGKTVLHTVRMCRLRHCTHCRKHVVQMRKETSDRLTGTVPLRKTNPLEMRSVFAQVQIWRGRQVHIIRDRQCAEPFHGLFW